MPEEAYAKRIVSEKIRDVFESYGYGEVITPAFEYLDLLKAKAGEEVVEQIYAFKDKAGRELGLRFEMTTPIARIVASRLDLAKPLRFYYVQPVWRYEEPQRGRWREFWQAGIELFGISEPEGDAEVVAVTFDALKAVGLKDFDIRVNDRRVVEDLVLGAGIPGDLLPSALRVLDKMDKFGEEYVVSELAKLGLREDAATSLLEKLKSGSLDIDTSTQPGREGLRRLALVVDTLKNCYGINVTVDYAIVRGLGYYTGFVFEVKAGSSEGLGSIAGGGRYDDLVSVVGGPKIPASGMAIGVERLLEALSMQGALKLDYREVDVYVIPVKKTPEILSEAVAVARELRVAGMKVVLEVSERSLSKLLEAASKRGARFAIILGERELKEGVVTVRDLHLWKEEKVARPHLYEYIRAGSST